MPRVNLLIADDVSLGKTIEAGLILSDLLLRRCIQRVLIQPAEKVRKMTKDFVDEGYFSDERGELW